ncbi:hypothetical protein Tco_0200039 [Tanacetum coccineum]
MPPKDDVLPAEEQPLPTAISHNADSPGYITESDPEVDPKEDDKDPEVELANYPDDTNDDKEEDESSGDVVDDEEEDEGKDEYEEEEEEQLAPADSVLPPACQVDKFLAISTQPSSPLTSYSSPQPQIPSPPLPVSSTLPISPPSSTSHLLPIVLLHTRESMAMMRVAAPSTYILAPRSRILPSETPPSGTPLLLPIPLPTPSQPLVLPSTNCRAGVSEVTLPPRKRLCITLGPRFEVGKSLFAPTTRPTRYFRRDYGFVTRLDDKIKRNLERDVGYKIIDTWDAMVEAIQEVPATDVAELSQRMTYFIMTVRQDTDEIYRRLDDAKVDRSLMSGQLNLLHRDRLTQARTARPMKECRRQTQLTEALTLLRTMQTQMAALQSQQTPVRDPAHLDVPEEADKREATRSENEEDNHDSGMSGRRQAPLARECTYPDFINANPYILRVLKEFSS